MNIAYKKIYLKDLLDIDMINKEYDNLINSKVSFFIIEHDNKKYVLTKEKSIFNIKSEEEFIEKCNRDEYYRTKFVSVNERICFEKKYKNEIKKALTQFWKEVKSRKEEMLNEYTAGYIFGCVAIRIGKTNSFITTIRGKKDFKEYTIVKNVDNSNNEVTVMGKKAALNAPLLFSIFKQNSNVSKIVHINHRYTKDEIFEYEFPGTKKDSIRNIKGSFNIRHHGFFELYDMNDKKA